MPLYCDRPSRREFVWSAALAGGTVLMGCGRRPFVTQQPAPMARIGWLSPSPPSHDAPAEAFQQRLREHGYAEGQNLAVERRHGEGPGNPLRHLAAELVALNVDLLVAGGPVSARAASDATSTIPIVMINGRDPVGTGLVTSLARPGGNVTGLASSDVELSGKRLELLKEALPGVSRVALLWTPTNAGHQSSFRETEAAAHMLGVQLVSVEIRDHNDVESPVEMAVRQRAEALIALRTPLTVNYATQLVDLAAQSRLPIMAEDRQLVEAGGFLAYGQNLTRMYRRAADYVDRILKGTKPGDLPVEQPREFELVINLRTAQALGLRIPPPLLLQAAEVIQ
jgi:putative tryptophan/tyrosine transport system substrate-binding protein